LCDQIAFCKLVWFKRRWNGFKKQQVRTFSSEEVDCMSSISFKAGKLPRLILALAGLSLLLAACADTSQNTASLNSAFPVNYNSGARGFDSHWPYGPNGYH